MGLTHFLISMEHILWPADLSTWHRSLEELDALPPVSMLPDRVWEH